MKKTKTKTTNKTKPKFKVGEYVDITPKSDFIVGKIVSHRVSSLGNVDYVMVGYMKSAKWNTMSSFDAYGGHTNATMSYPESRLVKGDQSVLERLYLEHQIDYYSKKIYAYKDWIEKTQSMLDKSKARLRKLRKKYDR